MPDSPAPAPEQQTTPSGKEPKYYVLDTNVLLHNPSALFVFQENHVVIPYPV
ncbi:MAG: PIN domain-containing protein, partial [Phycisphaerales bacterium]